MANKEETWAEQSERHAKDWIALIEHIQVKYAELFSETRNIVSNLTAQNATLSAQLLEKLEDSARLDWLSEFSASPNGGYFHQQWDRNTIDNARKTLKPITTNTGSTI